MTYPVTVIICLVGIISALYSLLMYRKKLGTWINLFLVFFMIDTALFLFSETQKNYGVFLSLEPVVNISFWVFFALWFIALMKGSLRRTWESVTGRKLLIFCGVGMLISIVLIAIGFFLEKFG